MTYRTLDAYLTLKHTQKNNTMFLLGMQILVDMVKLIITFML